MTNREFMVGFRPSFLEQPIVYGRKIEIVMPTGERRNGQFAVVEAQDIIASHNERTFATSEGYPTIDGQNINDRNYADDKNAQAKVIEVAQNLDPNILVTTSRTPAGTPIITKDGIVVSGNNRTMSIKLAIDIYPDKYDDYKKFLVEELPAFGIENSTATAIVLGDNIVDSRFEGQTFRDNKYIRFSHPILVRFDYDFPEYTTTELSKYNKETKKAERPIDKAIKLGKILNENENCKAIISGIVGQYETFSEFYTSFNDQNKVKNALQECNIITTQETPAYFDERGFTEAGKDLVENLLAGLVLEKEALIASNTAGARNMRNTIITSLPVLVKNSTFGPDSLIPGINRAFLLEKRIYASGLEFDTYLSQQNIFDERPDKEALFLNRLLALGRNAFKSSIEAYNDSIEANQGETLFGDKPTRSEIFSAHIISKITPKIKEMIERLSAPEISDKVTFSPPAPPEPANQADKMQQTQISQPIIEPATASYEQRLSWLVGDNYFKVFPDNVLGTPYEASGRFGTVIKYKGTIEDVKRIQAVENYVSVEKPDDVTDSLINPSLTAIMKDEQTAQNIDRAIKKAKDIEIPEKLSIKSKGAKRRIISIMADPSAELQSFQNIFRQYNPEISMDELRVFLWYKWHQQEELSADWYRLAGSQGESFNPRTAPINDWIQSGLLCYFRGDLLPEFLYLAENIWEKKSALEADKTEIINMHGQSVYDQQKEKLESVFKISYQRRLTLTNSNVEARLKILPVSNFAKTFKVATLADENPIEIKMVTAEKNPRYGRPDFLHVDAISWRSKHKHTFPDLNLQDAFCYWLVKYRAEYEIKKQISYADIINFYIEQKQRPRDYDDDAAWERLKNDTKLEGDRLFGQFLASALMLNDIVRIETEWNEKFNGYLPINYNKVPVAFPVSKEYRGEIVDIRPEKREAVAMLFMQGNCCLAYDVGVGKTWSALFGIRNQMAAGYCTRPLVIVPNQTYKQWLAEARGLLPDLRIYDLYNLSKDYLDELTDVDGMLRPVEENSISFVTYEGFERIGFTEQTGEMILWELEGILDQKPNQPPKVGRKAERERSAFRERLESLVGRGLRGAMVNIEDLGFDFTCFDEAHKMKKLFVGVKGEAKEDGKRDRTNYQIQSGGQPSSIALKGFMISHYIRWKNSGRNVLWLTATPFTNSPLDIFSVLIHLAYEQLKETNLNNLVNFFDNYVEVTNELVINSRLQPERKQIVKGFNNLVSLQQLIRRFVNYKTGEMVNVQRPNKYVFPLTHKIVNGQLIQLDENERAESSLPLSPLQRELMTRVREFVEGKMTFDILCSPGNEKNLSSDLYNKAVDIAERVEKGEEIEDEEELIDITLQATQGVTLKEGQLSDDEKAAVRMLRGMSFARNIALSPYLFECSGLGNSPTYKEYIETSPKLQYVVGCIRSIREWHKKDGSPMSGQVIYMDRGVEYFPLIKEYLVKELGFSDEEIGIIKSQMPGGKDAKENVKNKFLGIGYNKDTGEYYDLSDDERIKIVIGSSTIKEGINLQRYSTVLYDCFIDWNPTDIKQLEGRIWRQGNQFNSVRIVHPLVIDSMDIFIFQKLEEKTARINEIWNSDGETNTFDLSEFNPEELKFALISDPEVLAKLRVDSVTEQMKDDISSIKSRISRVEGIINDFHTFNAHKEDFEGFINEHRPQKAGAESRTFETQVRVFAEILKTDTDENGLRMPDYDYQRQHDKSVKWSPKNRPHKPYWADDLLKARRNIIRAEADFMRPNKLVESDLPAYLKSLQGEITAVEKRMQEVGSDAAIKVLAQQIMLEKEANSIKEPTISERIETFARYNYLLGDKRAPAVRKKKDEHTCPPLSADGSRRIDNEALEIIERCVSTRPSTKELNVDSHGNYTPERKNLHEKIIAETIGNAVCIRHERPIAILTGGPSGAGKSTFLKKYAPYLLSGNIFHIDADEIRAKIPEYEGWNATNTHLETKDIVNELLDHIGGKCKYDLVYDGTMNTSKNYFTLLNRIKSLGYETFIVYIRVPKEVSIERALARYQKTGRYVPLGVIDEIYENGEKALNELKPHVSGYIVVDGMTHEVVEQGGIQIPDNRDYSILTGTKKFEEQPPSEKISVKQYQDAIEGLTVLMEMETSKSKKKEYKDAIDGLKVMIEISAPSPSKKTVSNKQSELREGTQHEMEHADTIKKIRKGSVSTKQAAKMIAEDHLKEDPEYYKKLQKIEGEKLSKTEINVLRSLHLRGSSGSMGSMPLAKRRALIKGLAEKGLIDDKANLTPKGIELSK